MGFVGGFAVIVVIVLVAGLIAYIGDRVGHQVGRKRMTLFGLRPKYTSTIVAVGTGMMIALVVTLGTLAASGYARAAFFHLSDLNNRVNALQAQVDELGNVRKSAILVARGEPLYNQFLIVTPQESQSERLKAIGAYLDAVVASINKRLVPAGLRPFEGRSSDPEIAKKLSTVFDNVTVQGILLRGPALLVAVADANLVAKDTLSFTFAPYLDQPIFKKNETVASVEIDGGTAINPNIAYGQLVPAIRETAIAKGMPAFLANPLYSLTPAQVARTSSDIRAGHGRFYLVARATSDVSPHTGNLPVAFDLQRRPK